MSTNRTAEFWRDAAPTALRSALRGFRGGVDVSVARAVRARSSKSDEVQTLFCFVRGSRIPAGVHPL